MPSFLTPSAELHLNNVRTAAPHYVSEVVDLTMRNHMLIALMKEWGMIEYGANEASCIYTIQVYEHAVRALRDTTQKTFENQDLFEQMQVDTRRVETSDVLTEVQYKNNQSQHKFVDLLEKKLATMSRSLSRYLSVSMYQDGDATGNDFGWRGFESCLAEAGGTAAGDRYVLPSDSYGGHSTALGTFGGSWNGTAGLYNAGLANEYPHNRGTSEYDASSPLLVNWSSTAWGTSSAEWTDNCEYVMRDVAAVQEMRCGPSSAPLCMLMTAAMLSQAKNFYSQRTRIMTPYRSGDLGFPQGGVEVDGMVWKAEYGVPTGTFYGLRADGIEAFFYDVMNKGGDEAFIDVFGPTWDEATGAFLMRADAFGNLRMYPKTMIKGKNYA